MGEDGIGTGRSWDERRLLELSHIRLAWEDGASGDVAGITITARRPFSAKCLDVFSLFFYRWQTVGYGEWKEEA